MFETRSTKKEIMDDLAFEGRDMDQALYELEFINKWLGGNSLTTSGLEEILVRSTNKDFFSVADLGCGSGDMLRQIARWARNHSLTVDLTGIDANDYIVDIARLKSEEFSNIDFKTMNIFSPEFKELKFDIITATLFTHHFENKELIALFSQLKTQANKAILINDLHRHPMAYHSIKVLTSLFSRSNMVKNDAKLSVLRSFSRKDWEYIMQEAGITNYGLKWHWAFRWKLIIWL